MNTMTTLMDLSHCENTVDPIKLGSPSSVPQWGNLQSDFGYHFLRGI